MYRGSTMSSKNRDYTNGEVTVHWRPEKCIHSTICSKGLHEVFNPSARPWVNMDAASTEKIIAQVNECPSGALSISHNSEGEKQTVSAAPVIQVLKDGPYVLSGDFEIKDAGGNPVTAGKKAALCRCGVSESKPFCDGAHARNNFSAD